MTIELFRVSDKARLAEALALRIAVFVEEQGVPLADEIDDHDRDDPNALHAIGRSETGLLAAGRFYEKDAQTVQIGRMAVRWDARRRGAGTALLRALMSEAQRLGYTRAVLWAQTEALEFYRREGFTEKGVPFFDAGIAHREMTRAL